MATKRLFAEIGYSCITESCVYHYMSTLLSNCSLSAQPPLSSSQFRKNFTRTSNVYKSLGVYFYDISHITADHIHTWIEKDIVNWIYIGEVKEGTSHIPHGIGIQVDSYGDIFEGYWKDGELHSRGRNIDSLGSYYIGEFKEGKFDGEGTLYCGKKILYEGGWRNGDRHGQGTYYQGEDKYIGQWDGDWKGRGEIIYADGSCYKGHWYADRNDHKLNRHGSGTLYPAEGGLVIKGIWKKDKCVIKK